VKVDSYSAGETVTEIIHIGQAVIAFGGTIDYFRDTVFNYPTMAECYKVAAFDGLNKLALDRNSTEDLATVAPRPAQHAA
jgi:NAD(P) transhydrogenase